MNRIHLWASFSLIAVILLSTLLLLFYHFGPGSRKQKSPILDTFMQQASIISYNSDGQPKNFLSFTQMSHFSHHNTAFFTNPNLLAYPQPHSQRRPWHITANYGLSYYNHPVITLWKNVKLHQTGTLSPVGTTIVTSRLKYYPHTDIATSRETVTLSKSDMIMTGKGMRANLKRGTIQLLTHSQGDYVFTNNSH